MNNRREYYYPVIAYAMLLALVWLSSWVADMITMFSGGAMAVKSLVGSEGVRWAARNAVQSLNAVPWGTVMLLLAMAALLNGAGIIRMLYRLFTSFRLTKNEKRSALFAVSALLLYVLLVYLATLSPLNVFLGVTGHYEGSPLMHGMPLVVFVAVLTVSLIYGFMYGNYRSPLDVVASMENVFSLFMPALIALIPASGIMPCMEYTGLLELAGCAGCPISLVSDIMYMIPFLYIILLYIVGNCKEKE